MDIAVWDDSYKTGHAMVDTQHQGVFKMVNELHAAIVKEKGKEPLMPTLEKLAKYRVEHFLCEEILMNQVQYPARGAHKEKHDHLTSEVKELVEKYRTGKAVLTITLSSFLASGFAITSRKTTWLW